MATEAIEVIPETAEQRPGNVFSAALAELVPPSTEVEEIKVEKAPAKAAEKAPEAAADDTSFIPPDLLEEKKVVEKAKEEELPANTPRWAREAIARANERAAATEKELDRLRAEAKQPTGDYEKTAAELKAEREARTALEERIERHAFRESPAFEKLQATEAGHLEAAKSLLPEDASKSLIEEVAVLSPTKRRAALRDAGIDEDVVNDIAIRLSRLDEARDATKSALENHKAISAQARAEQERQQEQEVQGRKQAEEKIFAESWTDVEKTLGIRRVDGQDKWNAKMDAIEERAKAIYFGELAPKDAAIAARAAAAAEFAYKELMPSMRAELAKLRAQVGKMTAAQPGLGDARNGNGSHVTVTPGARWNAELQKASGG